MQFQENVVDIESFKNGFCLQSENMRNIASIDTSSIKTLVFIENRTNYRQHLQREKLSNALVVYHGGFYSPTKKTLFQMIADGLNPTTEVQFWGDIDLGGFLMYTRLKNEIFPMLKPWKMGLDDFELYMDRGVHRANAYLDNLRKKLLDKQFDQCFFPMAQQIIKTGVTVEQEIML